MLKRWGYVQEASYHVCRGEAKGDKAGSLSHILSRCKAVWIKDAIPGDMTLCYSASTNLFEKWSIGLLLA